jgi:hypothetical protein
MMGQTGLQGNTERRLAAQVAAMRQDVPYSVYCKIELNSLYLLPTEW